MALELDKGDPIRAREHRDEAEASLVALTAKLNACKPVVNDRDGDGVPDEQDACPDVPGPPSLLGCPDRDGDGITDNIDRCPDVPEDLDGVEDDDGCPEEHDRDGDGILDKDDKCPDLPETRNGYEDDDGCPDINPSLVVVRRDLGKIEIKQKIYFDTGKTTIKPISFGLLDEVAEVLKSEATMKIAIEGHTDAQGSDAFNQKLSEGRAQSVRAYLVSAGIDATRLTAVGFGETQPIADNRSSDGREMNRRVEFRIVGEP